MDRPGEDLVTRANRIADVEFCAAEGRERSRLVMELNESYIWKCPPWSADCTGRMAAATSS